MIRIVVTVDDKGRLSVQGAEQGTGALLPVDVVFGTLTAAWAEVLALKIKQTSGLIMPQN